MRQRLILAVGIALCAAVWFLMRGTLTSADGVAGLTLSSSGAGWALAVIVALLASLPVMGVAGVASAGGHPLSGLFVASASLIFLACAGGSMDGWVRGVHSPAGYRALAVEMVLWQLGAMLVLAGITMMRMPLRCHWAWLAREEQPALPLDRLLRPAGGSFLAGLVTAVVAGIATTILLRSPQSGQVIGSLLVAFMLGGLAGQMALPQVKNPLGMLLAPMVVACVAYFHTSMHYQTAHDLLAGWFNQASASAGLGDRVPGPAMALPIHYISAGLTGTILGITLGQCIQAAQKQVAQVA